VWFSPAELPFSRDDEFSNELLFIVCPKAPVPQWIERLFPKQKAEGSSTPSWRDSRFFLGKCFSPGFIQHIFYFFISRDFIFAASCSSRCEVLALLPSDAAYSRCKTSSVLQPLCFDEQEINQIVKRSSLICRDITSLPDMITVIGLDQSYSE
jgi:hypothetical protein